MQSRTRQWIVTLAAVLVLAGGVLTGSARGDVERRVDINTASAEELAGLPGIGDSKAKAIVEYRAADPFHTVDDLKKVKGIGDKTLEALRQNLMVSDAAPAKK